MLALVGAIFSLLLTFWYRWTILVLFHCSCATMSQVNILPALFPRGNCAIAIWASVSSPLCCILIPAAAGGPPQPTKGTPGTGDQGVAFWDPQFISHARTLLQVWERQVFHVIHKNKHRESGKMKSQRICFKQKNN